MQVALDAGASPKDLSFAGPGKTDLELARAIAAGITINLESEGEMLRADQIGQQLGIRPRVAVRVNPDFELKTSGMKMSGGPKQFGIDAERVPDVLRQIAQLDFQFRGFHIFSGSQNLKPEAIQEAQTQTAHLAIELAADAPEPVRTLNLGGGFGIPYFPGDRPLDLAPIAETLGDLVPHIRAAMPEAEIILELGRFLVGEAGIYVCRVIDRKMSRGHCFLVTDGGLHHHLAASGNFGQVIRKNYPVLVGNRVYGSSREVASVVGPLCTPLDVLADKIAIPNADVGDLIVVLQSGAYGLSASPTHFLSHPAPAEILI
jgi:diaminopimelate decarboxylase